MNPYAASKVAQDYISYVYFKSWIKCCKSKNFNHEGPRREKVLVFHHTLIKLQKLKLSKAPILVGYLNDKRNFTHISDITEAYWLATEKCKIGKLYLIGNENKGSIFTFKQALEKLKKNPSLKI